MLFTESDLDRMPYDRLMWALKVVSGHITSNNPQTDKKLWNMLVDAIERKTERDWSVKRENLRDTVRMNVAEWLDSEDTKETNARRFWK
jgi:hypothetical protein